MNVRTVIIRSNQVAPDSRVEKEAAALKEKEVDIKVLAWDRRTSHKPTLETLDTFGQLIPIVRFGHKAEFGRGLGSIIPYMGFQLDLFLWLIRNKGSYNVIHACDFDTEVILTF